MNARCPRCGGGFDCGAASGVCACFEIRLTPEQQAEIAATWDDCLCLACLREFSRGDVLPRAKDSQPKAPAR